MDEQNQQLSGEDVSTNDSVGGGSGVLSAPVIPTQSEQQPDQPVSSVEASQGEGSDQSVMQSDILAPRQNLSEALSTLKEFEQAPQEQPQNQSVQAEEITAETKLTEPQP